MILPKREGIFEEGRLFLGGKSSRRVEGIFRVGITACVHGILEMRGWSEARNISMPGIYEGRRF